MPIKVQTIQKGELLLEDELRSTGWIFTFLGVFIAIYGAFATAIDSSMRGYGVGEIKKYATEVTWMYNFYIQVFCTGAFMALCGLLLAVPLLIQAKKQSNKA